MKVLKSRIFAFILGGIIFSAIGVFAYSYNAGQITYTPKDSNWKVNNVASAINDLYKGAGSGSSDNGNIRLSKFSNEYISNHLTASTYESTVGTDGFYHSKSSIDYNYESNDNFEISMDIDYNNTLNDMMGGIKIYFYDGNASVGNIVVYDSWGSEKKTVLGGSINSKNINLSYTSSANCSGRYAIVRNNNKLYFYQNSTSLNSVDFNENFKFNKIVVDFIKYPGYNVVDTNVKNIYIGNIKNY